MNAPVARRPLTPKRARRLHELERHLRWLTDEIARRTAHGKPVDAVTARMMREATAVRWAIEELSRSFEGVLVPASTPDVVDRARVDAEQLCARRHACGGCLRPWFCKRERDHEGACSHDGRVERAVAIGVHCTEGQST